MSLCAMFYELVNNELTIMTIKAHYGSQPQYLIQNATTQKKRKHLGTDNIDSDTNQH